jgi:hypothetical protein
VFTANGQPERRIRTLRQFVCELEHVPAPQLADYIARGDFSRWIDDVFGDHALAAELRTLEGRARRATRDDTPSEMASAVRGRYDLSED